MNGKKLQQAIKNSGISVNEILEKTGIKRTTFYTLYKSDEIEQHYLDKIKSAGVELNKSEQIHTEVNQLTVYLELIESLKRENRLLNEIIKQKSK